MSTRKDAKSVVVDIHATILKPLDEDDDYVVLVSAFPADAGTRLEAFPHLSAPVRGLKEARERRRLLVDRMREDFAVRGIKVRDVMLKG